MLHRTLKSIYHPYYSAISSYSNILPIAKTFKFNYIYFILNEVRPKVSHPSYIEDAPVLADTRMASYTSHRPLHSTFVLP